ncbi:hypothetical protein [Portibacter lacus]|nr:hypothetical protein [Portibacter lacus]
MKTTQLHSNYKTLQSKIILTLVSIILVGASLFGQKVEIQGDANISGQLEVMDTILFSDGTTLASACLQILQDSDADTKIEVEKNADEDIIRFTIKDVEIARFENNRLELADGGGSVFIGYKAGASDDATNNKSVYIGYETGQQANGFANTAVGANAFQNNSNGSENTTIGVSSGYQSLGSNNVFVGRDAGREAAGGNDNTYLGHSAGKYNRGSGNIFLGKDADIVGTVHNKLLIDNNYLQTPFIYGEMDGRKLEMDAWTRVLRRLDIDDNSLQFTNMGSGDTNKGIKFGSTTAGLIGITFENNGNYKDKLHFKTFYDQGGFSLLTLNGENGNIGIGEVDPQTKLHIRGSRTSGHVMKIENTSTSASADGLEIKINRTITGSLNNYITFTDANSTTGRIEGFALGEGPNFTDFPGIDFSVYFDVNAIINAVFTPGSFPTLNPGSFPSLNRGSLPSLSGGSFGSLSFNVDFDDLADNLACQANPFCNSYKQWISGGISGASFPTLNPGALPYLYGGSLPYLSGGSLPQFNINGLINPSIQTTAYADMEKIVGWAFENGIEALSADPYSIKLMNDPDYWANIATQKHGGVTYGSKGADYAEWLEREDPSKAIKGGQIVGVKNGKISLNTEGADQIMAISVMPVVLGNMPDSSRVKDFEKVAFIGQTPVWVVGDVESGDYIIASGQNDGYGLAVAEEELTIEQISKVVGRAWEDGDKIVNLVNMAVGLKTNEMANILGRMSKEMNTMDQRLTSIETMLNAKELAFKE